VTRVALLPGAYLPTLGGVQELTRNLAIALRDGGDHVEIWCQQADGIDNWTVDELDGFTVRHFPFPLPRADVRSLPPLVRRGSATMRTMRRAVHEFRPDVLHVQCFGPNGVYATALSTITRVPLVVSLQGETVMDDFDVYEHSVTMRTMLRLAIRRAAAVTGCSAFTLRDAESRFGLRPGRGQVIFNGVALEQPASSAQPPVSGRYVLALGRVVHKKGFDLLLRGFAELSGYHDVSLVIGGEGPELPPLRRLAADLKIADRVQFVGRLSREDVAALTSRADIFVLPSRVEPFGIVVLEAWRAGCPVIATTHGGPPEFVDEGETGLLVDPADHGQMAAALAKLLDDQQLRHVMGDRERARVQTFAWPRIADRYRVCYGNISRSARSAMSSDRRESS
jgi:glycogen synthase